MSLACHDIWHRYGNGGAWVLRSVDLEIEAGAITAVVGPSGSGKTTLLSIAGLLLRPTRGSVTFEGAEFDESGKPVFNRLAWVFQTANALGQRSVLDNVALGLVSNGLPHGEARQRALHSLDLVGLRSARNRKARELSGGELQRVNLARALIGNPEFLFADEPTAHLDRANAEFVVRSLVELRKPSTTVLMATHDPIVSECADQVIEVVNGRLGVP